MNDGVTSITYACPTPGCPNHNQPWRVDGTPEGPFYRYPLLRCACGVEPRPVVNDQAHSPDPNPTGAVTDPVPVDAATTAAILPTTLPGTVT